MLTRSVSILQNINELNIHSARIFLFQFFKDGGHFLARDALARSQIQKTWATRMIFHARFRSLPRLRGGRKTATA